VPAVYRQPYIGILNSRYCIIVRYATFMCDKDNSQWIHLNHVNGKRTPSPYRRKQITPPSNHNIIIIVQRSFQDDFEIYYETTKLLYTTRGKTNAVNIYCVNS